MGLKQLLGLHMIGGRLYLNADHAGWLAGQNLPSCRVGQGDVFSAGQLLGGESTHSVYSFSMFPAAHAVLLCLGIALFKVKLQGTCAGNVTD